MSFRAILADSQWLLLQSIVGRFSWLICLLAIAPYVGEHDYGYFSFYLALWILCYKVAGVGLETWVKREVARSTSDQYRSEAIQRALIIRLLHISFVVASLVILISFSGLPPPVMIPILLCVRQWFESVREVLVGLLQGFKLMKQQARVMSPLDVIQLCLVSLVILFFENSLFLILLIFITVSFSKCVLLYEVISREIKSKVNIFDLKQINYIDTVKDSLPIGVMLVSGVFLGKLYILLLMAFHGSNVVGYFAFAMLIVTSLDIVFGTVRQSLFPRFSRYEGDGDSKILKKTIIVVTIFSMFSIIVAIAGYYSSDLIFDIPYFESMIEAKRYLEHMMLALPLVVISGLLANLVNAVGLSKAALRSTLSILIFGIFISLPLIYTYEVLGVISTMLIVRTLSVINYFRIIKMGFPA